jgi:hypothetical protein
MTKLPNKITITITPEDAEKACSYYDRHSCLLGAAVQRELGLEAGQIICGGTTIDLCGTRYKLGSRGGTKVTNSYSHPAEYDSRPTVRKPFKVHLSKV